MWVPGLILAIGTSLFLDIIFLALGAVLINADTSELEDKYRSKSGQISLAGPMSNIFIGIASIIALYFLVYEYSTNGFATEVTKLTIRVSALFAAFNMIPLPPLNGWKIWLFTVLIAAGLFLFVWFGLDGIPFYSLFN